MLPPQIKPSKAPKISKSVIQTSKPTSGIHTQSDVSLSKWNKTNSNTNKTTVNTFSQKKKTGKGSPGDWFGEDEIFL